MTGPLTEENLRALCWMAWREFNAIRARSGAPLNHDGITTMDETYWSCMTDALEAAAGYSTPWPSETHRPFIEGIMTARRALVSDTSEQAISIFDPETPKPPEKPWSEVWAGVDGNTRGDGE